MDFTRTLELVKLWHEAEEAAKYFVKDSLFLQWLVGVLDDPKRSPLPITDFSEDYPCLVCYRGTGQSLRIEYVTPTNFDSNGELAKKPEERTINSCFEADWGQDSEHVKYVRHYFNFPQGFLTPKASLKDFTAWATETRNKSLVEARKKVIEEAAKLGIKLK
jgi:hypothetical protein